MYSLSRRNCLIASGGEKKWRKLWKDGGCPGICEKQSINSDTSSNYLQRSQKTLDDRVKGQVVHGTNPGIDTVLSPMEEKALCNYLVYMVSSNAQYGDSFCLGNCLALWQR